MAEDMFRPPINRSMRTLDKAFFQKELLTAAARVPDVKRMSETLKTLRKSKDVFGHSDFPHVRDVADGSRGHQKCIVLHPKVQADDRSTWTPTVTDLVEKGEVSLIPFKVNLDYNFWSAGEILRSVLPEDLHDEIPTSFNQAGHIAHLNLRDQQLPYRHLIGEVVLSKGSGIRTVINKKETLGSENEFRVLDFEILAGEDDLNTEVRECGSIFRFDYAKVFWNSKLQTEHDRLVQLFKSGEVVCDAMAGVGPFAIPAGRNGVFVWANDLNPDCFGALEDAIGINKVSHFVSAFNEDGHSFIRSSSKRLLESKHAAKVLIRMSRTQATEAAAKNEPTFRSITQPPVFSHYVMNLPSTAIDFLPDFIGVYAGHANIFTGSGGYRLPMIHCYCFGAKYETSEEDTAVQHEVCGRISEKLGCTVSLDDADTTIWDVRDVAPNKRQLCASFRLPAEAAFRKMRQ